MTSLFRQEALWEKVKNPITDEQVTTWLENLRSGKFDQGTGQLCSINGYCCLGVLAKQLDLFDTAGYLHTNGELNKLEWDEEAKFLRSVYHQLPSGIQEVLATLNDGGMTFTKIADIIEEGFFTEYDAESGMSKLLEKAGFDHDWLDTQGLINEKDNSYYYD